LIPLLTLLTLLSGAALATPSEFGVTQQPTGIEGKPDGFGIGLVLGQPTGLAFALRNEEKSNIQAGMGWSFQHRRIHLTGDYTRNLFIFRPDDTPKVRYALYAGLGGRVIIGSASGDSNKNRGDLDAASLGVRVPVGFAMLPTDQRIDVFLEVAPVMLLIPSAKFGFDAALGSRIFF
jgi:hypothetical protein